MEELPGDSFALLWVTADSPSNIRDVWGYVNYDQAVGSASLLFYISH